MKYNSKAMLKALLLALFLVILSEGYGHCFLKILRLEKNGFTAPIGVAILFSFLELLYLPRLCLGGHFTWIKGSTCIVLVVGLICMFYSYKEMFHSLFRARTIYVLIACCMMAGLFYLCKTNLAVSNDSELQLMAKNVNSLSIMLENSRLQGYEMFGSFIIWIFKGNLEYTALTLALFATMISVMLALDMVDSFNIGNPWFRLTLIFSSVFYYQFYSWKIAGAYQGGNWRIIFISLGLFTLYEWLKTKQENIKYLVPFVIGAGMFSHNGFLMIGFEMVYLSSVYLFHIKKIRSLYDVTTFLIPVVIYVSAWLSKYSKWAGIALIMVGVLFYLARLRRKFYLKIIHVEDFLIDHSWKLFFVAIPLVFLVGTFFLRYFTINYSVHYSEYIKFFSSKGIGSALFLDGSILDYLLDIFRWGGMIVFLMKAKTDEEKMIRMIFLGMVAFFINPLCMGMLSQITGLEMYAHAFEIIFNPFTDVMIFYWIYKQFEWTVIGQWVLELTLVITCVLGHVSSFTNHPSGLYTDLLTRDPQSGRVILP